jgi:dolichyl-phosphate beta-glucosyltransferase
VPCYNAADYIARSLELLRGYCDAAAGELGTYEIIVVDDGSRDATVQVLNGQAAKVIRLDTNRGKGAAVRTGMLAARGEYRFFVDGDLPYDLRALSVMLRYLDFKEFDVVIGTRSIRQADPYIRRTAMRKFASALFTALVSRLVVTGVRDTQCGLKGFRAKAAEYLFAQSRINRFAFDVEILYLAYKNDLDIKRVPVELLREDVSTVRVIRDGLQMLGSVVAIPLRYYTGRYTMMRHEAVRHEAERHEAVRHEAVRQMAARHDAARDDEAG